jgi:hypothetical protein
MNPGPYVLVPDGQNKSPAALREYLTKSLVKRRSFDDALAVPNPQAKVVEVDRTTAGSDG